MEGDFIKINDWLRPFSWIYGLGVNIRNILFEIGLLKSRSFNIPIISVGNITVGGTGKTPHVEYLIELLKDQFNVAVLSRGYKRKSRGFVLATSQSKVTEIGDEPYQMKLKYPDVTVAVDKNRCHGIEQLMDDRVAKDIDVILLDDAFQHRYVKPGVNILLQTFIQKRFFADLLHSGDVIVASADDACDLLALDLVGIEAEGCSRERTCRFHDYRTLVVHLDDGCTNCAFRNNYDVVQHFLADLIGQCSSLLDGCSVDELVDLGELYHLASVNGGLHAWRTCRLYTDHLGFR